MINGTKPSMAAALVVAFASPTIAEIIEYRYQGTVTGIEDELNILGDIVGATTFEGRFFVDTSEVLLDAPTQRRFNVTSHSVEIGGREFVATTAGLSIRDDFLTPGPFGVNVDEVDLSGTPELPAGADDGFMSFILEGGSDWFTGLGVPGTDVFDPANPAVNAARFSLLFTAGDGIPFFDRSFVSGEVTTIERIPAPGTALPFLGVLALARRRR
ncbi:MAG: hypothetical protein AAGK04_03870 [Planctomycetota bacterium]